MCDVSFKLTSDVAGTCAARASLQLTSRWGEVSERGSRMGKKRYN